MIRRPVLPILVLVTAPACGGWAADRHPSAPHGADEIVRWERQVHDRVNVHRAELRLDRLRHDDVLARIARDHSLAMAAGRAPFSHDGFAIRLSDARALRPVHYMGETLARVQPATSGAPATAVARWLRSATHRVVVEGCFDSAGVGIARGPDDTLYITQIFARTAGARVSCR